MERTKSVNGKKRLFADFALFLIAAAFDLITKAAAADRLKGQPELPLLPGILELRYLENHGAAFSLFQNGRIMFSIVAVSAVILIAAMLLRPPATRRYLPFRLCLVAVAAGAAGNLADRLLYGYVRDFIYFVLIDFPIFNVADIYVTCAAALLCILILFYYREEDFAFLRRRVS
ncbi:signal peptidase II [Lachnoclostridium sp. Marseille-P6806]|uniref:signal peptidase II n=1 Tax=Lachnoclostridium sp. Marseille-P6806 TaxID=2364793 RepID=UPI001030CDAD|nr:signal peptidase II [Lachnoclostridium sp. Marseille-P6806]